MTPGVTIHCGDALTVLRRMPAESARCCVTSPPYWGLRDYGTAGQLGLEPTPEDYVAHMVSVFREVRRVLTNDGTLWLNLGDCYATGVGARGERWAGRDHHPSRVQKGTGRQLGPMTQPNRMPIEGLKPKDLVGVPWRVAFALQADGWYLRSDIIWSKPNPMPESVHDRPTKSHEYLFLLSKSERYFYDAAASSEPATGAYDPRNAKAPDGWDQDPGSHGSIHRNGRAKGRSGNVARKLGDERGRPDSHLGGSVPWEGTRRNRRSVWTVAPQPFRDAHFATFPPALIEPCILAGSEPGNTVLDPFMGAGTTALVARDHGRRVIGIEINPAYIDLAAKRLAQGVLDFGGVA